MHVKSSIDAHICIYIYKNMQKLIHIRIYMYRIYIYVFLLYIERERGRYLGSVGMIFFQGWSLLCLLVDFPVRGLIHVVPRLLNIHLELLDAVVILVFPYGSL